MKPRVLLVEDDPVSRAFFLEVLAGMAVDVDAASTCAAALAHAARRAHALWLVDAHLPDGAAATLLPRLRALAPGEVAPAPVAPAPVAPAPVVPAAVAIAHTASRDARLHADLRAAGCAGVLVKPFAPADLRALCLRHLPDAAADSAVDAATPAAWDDAAAAVALGGDPGRVREMRALYRAELPAALARVDAAVRAADADAVRAVLHRLAAASAFAGARGMAAAVRRLRQAPLDPDALAAFRRAAAEPPPS